MAFYYSSTILALDNGSLIDKKVKNPISKPAM